MAEEETPAVEEVVAEVVEEPTAEEAPAETEVVEEEAPVSKSKSKKAAEVVEEVVETQAVEEPVFNEVTAAKVDAIASIPTMKQPTPGTLIALSSRERN
jgi:hypothetical protein